MSLIDATVDVLDHYRPSLLEMLEPTLDGELGMRPVHCAISGRIAILPLREADVLELCVACRLHQALERGLLILV